MTDFDFSKPHRIVDGEFVHLTDEEIAQAPASKAAWDAECARQKVTQEIIAIEQTVTPRRLMDALLTDEGKLWLSNIEIKIAELRKSGVFVS